MIKRLPSSNIRLYRKIVQYLFLATVVLIGIKFTLFVGQLEKGMTPTISRPPGIEAFLPISSLISLKYWIVGGVFNQVHPSGLIIFSMALATGLLLKRGFCSWICPFGLLTEYLNRLHTLIYRKNIKTPRWLDCPLRSLKYLLLAFFLFIGGSLAARITGHWQTGISNAEYLFHIRHLGLPIYQHNRGEVPDYNKEAWLRMMQQIKESQGEMRWTHVDPEPSGIEK